MKRRVLGLMMLCVVASMCGCAAAPKSGTQTDSPSAPATQIEGQASAVSAMIREAIYRPSTCAVMAPIGDTRGELRRHTRDLGVSAEGAAEWSLVTEHEGVTRVLRLRDVGGQVVLLESRRSGGGRGAWLRFDPPLVLVPESVGGVWDAATGVQEIDADGDVAQRGTATWSLRFVPKDVRLESGAVAGVVETTLGLRMGLGVTTLRHTREVERIDSEPVLVAEASSREIRGGPFVLERSSAAWSGSDACPREE